MSMLDKDAFVEHVRILEALLENTWILYFQFKTRLTDVYFLRKFTFLWAFLAIQFFYKCFSVCEVYCYQEIRGSVIGSIKPSYLPESILLSGFQDLKSIFENY